ncbi:MULTISPECIES: YtxH domain-containing protein [Flagellimonas]|uniref:YtxH domain-containing protein n=1 Tax=Flagellimonas hadalis TaxID=2597517 RepID=A0A5N5IWZ5_9FLAO|nr:YtxH domain-containing protein [Allomuricauda hadalis]KAB5488875.1 YtxH domain-containing protein [Allomuricauda hadalis]RUA19358.1 MAG: YtxH domain-containing protein [Flavobacteriia bacterium]
MSNNSGNVLVALLTGAVVGAGVGILYAPDKGQKTRKKIKNSAIKAKDDISASISNVKDELTKTADAKKAEFEAKLEDTLSNMSYKADDIIVALEKKLEDLRKKNAQLQK